MRCFMRVTRISDWEVLQKRGCVLRVGGVSVCKSDESLSHELDALVESLVLLQLAFAFFNGVELGFQ